MPTYLISIGDDRMLGLCTGEDPADAIDAYYAGLDADCEPFDELTETFSVAKVEVQSPPLRRCWTRTRRATRCRRSRGLSCRPIPLDGSR